MEPPEVYKGYFARGEETEKEALVKLAGDGWMLARFQEEVVMHVTEEIKVVGHVDATGIDTNELDGHGSVPILGRVVEIKRMNDAYWNLVKNNGIYGVKGLMEKYLWQISVYMIALNMEAVFVFVNGDTGEYQYFYLETPPHEPNEIIARVLVIEGRARSFGTLADLGACDSADYPCPFYYTHSEEDKREALDGEEAERLEGLGVSYQIARDRAKAADDDSKRIRREIESLMGDRRKVSSGSVRVTRYDTTRKSLDRKRLAADGIDLSQYESERTYPAVRVTVNEERETDGNEVDQ